MVIMTLISIPLMDRSGRRALHLYGLGGMFIFSIFITISFLVKVCKLIKLFFIVTKYKIKNLANQYCSFYDLLIFTVGACIMDLVASRCLSIILCRLFCRLTRFDSMDDYSGIIQPRSETCCDVRSRSC